MKPTDRVHTIAARLAERMTIMISEELEAIMPAPRLPVIVTRTPIIPDQPASDPLMRQVRQLSDAVDQLEQVKFSSREAAARQALVKAAYALRSAFHDHPSA